MMAPDLELRVLLDDPDRERAQRIVAATRQAGGVPLEVRRGSRLPGRKAVQLVSGSAHDLLADSATWNAATWDKVGSQLPQLVRTFEVLYAAIPEAFSVEVMWVGEQAEVAQPVSRSELLRLAAHGRLGTHTRYLVEQAGAHAGLSNETL